MAVSPTTLMAIPPAIRIHGAFRRPDIKVDPPTTRLSSSRSPTGYARLVTVERELPPDRARMLGNANAEHTAAAPAPATAPSSQLGVASFLTSPRMKTTNAT